MKPQIRHRTDDELAHEATMLCGRVNDALRGVTEREGFANAHRRMFAVALSLAPSWDWIETTEAADASPTVCLTQPKDYC